MTSSSAATAMAAARDDTDEQLSSSSSLFTSLPENPLQEIFSFLTFFECRKVAGLSKSLWRLQREQIEENMQHLTVTKEDRGRMYMLHPFRPDRFRTLQHTFGRMNQSLQSLNLNRACTDLLLYDMFVGARLFPNLLHLKIPCCVNVTDLGLEYLSRVTHCRNLELLDITYCSHTTYQGTLAFRRNGGIRFPMLRVIRRQPEWLDGHIETPFGNPLQRQVHTYYADGSFRFSNREDESNGFVCEYIPGELQDEDLFVRIKIQFNDFPLQEGAPPWIPFAYRPSVCLLRLPPAPIASEEEDDQEAKKKNDTSSRKEQNEQATRTTTNAVLVGQYSRDTRGAPNRAFMERVAQDEELVPFGEIRYFDKKTEALLPNPNHNIDMIMISRMRIRPFSARDEHDESAAAAADNAATTTRRIDLLAGAPPSDLIGACDSTCRRIQAYEPEFLRRREDELNADIDRALADAAQEE